MQAAVYACEIKPQREISIRVKADYIPLFQTWDEAQGKQLLPHEQLFPKIKGARARAPLPPQDSARLISAAAQSRRRN
jgi:hypothetical protein